MKMFPALTKVPNPARSLKRRALLTALCLLALGAPADGIPEPDLIFYGSIRNQHLGVNIRFTVGTLAWRFTPAAGGPSVTVSTTLTNINDQFSYVLRVPCEAFVPGLTPSTNKLQLAPIPKTYQRTSVEVDGHPATLVFPAPGVLTLAPSERGRLEQVDLSVSFTPDDSDGNGLPDAWELRYFGRTGLDPSADADRDELNNLAEYLAGTDPTDPASQLAILEIQHDRATGAVIRWSSLPSRIYAIERSSDLLRGFAALQSGIAASPPFNVYHDRTAVGSGPFFYRVRLESITP